MPVAEVTRLEENGAAPSTNTEEIQDTRGKKKAGGAVAMGGEDCRDGGCCNGDNASLVEGVAERLSGCTSSRC